MKLLSLEEEIKNSLINEDSILNKNDFIRIFKISERGFYRFLEEKEIPFFYSENEWCVLKSDLIAFFSKEID